MTGELAETLLDQAIAALTNPHPGISGTVADVLEQASSRIGTIPPDDPHLGSVRNKLSMVRTLAGQAAGFYRGLRQVDPELVVAYSPSGIEEAL